MAGTNVVVTPLRLGSWNPLVFVDSGPRLALIVVLTAKNLEKGIDFDMSTLASTRKCKEKFPYHSLEVGFHFLPIAIFALVSSLE